MSKPTVFVSYSHQDEQWKERIVSQLGVLQQAGLLEVWDDRRIEPGRDWEPEIEAALKGARVALLLISEYFLNSRFILSKEVPALLQRRESDGLQVVPVILSSCAWQKITWLNPIQLLPKNGKALFSFAGDKRNQELAKIALKVSELLEEKAAEEPPGRTAAELLQAYCDKLREKVSRVRLLGEAESRPLQQVFVALSMTKYRRPTAHDEWLGFMDAEMRRKRTLFDPDDSRFDGDGSEPQPRTVRPDELLRDGTRAVVTGAPGGGKSTLLRWLAGQLLNDDKAEAAPRLPVFLELKSLTAEAVRECRGDLGDLLFERAVASGFHFAHPAERERLKAAFRARLAAQGVAVLLDGLDEVRSAAFFDDLCKAVNHFLHSDYNRNVVVISTRPYALDVRFDGAQEMEIAPLSPPQVEAFLRHYYGDDPTLDVAALTAQLKRRELSDLIRVPVLLGALVRRYREKKELTGDRLKLYDGLVRDLAVTLDRERNVQRFKVSDPEGRRKLDFLERLAFKKLFESECEREAERLTFDGDWMLEEAKAFCAGTPVDAYEFAADVKATPLLREVGEDVWAFSHLTLHEFLAARALSRRADCEQVFCRAYFNAMLAEMEVLPMTLSIARKPDALYELLERLPDSLNYINLRLQLRGIVYGAVVDDKIWRELIDQILQFLPSEYSPRSPYTQVIINCLTGIGGQYREHIVDVAGSLLQTRERYKVEFATEILGCVGGERGFNILLELARSKSLKTRQDAAEALGETGDGRAVSVLLDDLNWMAAIALRKIGSKDAQEGLLKALKSPDHSIRFAVVMAVGAVGMNWAVDGLIELLDDENEGVRWWAAKGLGEIGDEQAVESLRGRLQSPDSHLRWNAAVALGEILGRHAAGILCDCLKSEDYQERLGAALALAKIGNGKAADVLFAALENDGDPDRWNIPSALAAISSENVIGRLLVKLNDGDSVISRLAANALGKIRSKEAIDGLYVALNSSDKYLPLRAALELAAIGDHCAATTLADALEWEKDENGRKELIEALGELGDARAVMWLLQHLANESPFVQKRAAKLLNQMPQHAVTDGLLKTISHEYSFLRRKAAEVLGYYSLQRATDALGRLAESDPDPEVRQVAARALERLRFRQQYCGEGANV